MRGSAVCGEAAGGAMGAAGGRDAGANDRMGMAEPPRERERAERERATEGSAETTVHAPWFVWIRV